MTERLWYKIGDTARMLGVTPKDLRYWEKVLPELRPRRSQGNLRYYHKDDIPRLMHIRRWLLEGFTVADCRELLEHGHVARGLGLGLEVDPPAPEPPRNLPEAPRSLPEAPRSTPKAPRPTTPPKEEMASQDLVQGLKKLLHRLQQPPRSDGHPKRELDTNRKHR